VIPLGLSATELRALNTALTGHHSIRVRVGVRLLNGQTVNYLTANLLDGQVNVDTTAGGVNRSATLQLLDPDRNLPFDSDTPDDAALFLDRMVHIVYDVNVSGAWTSVPVFTGPVSKLDRAGDVITVEAQGKEVLASGACWRPLAIPKGTLKTDAIRRILSERSGEAHFDIPDLPGRLPKPLSLTRESAPWPAAQGLATSLNRQLFYDGDGTCRLRRWPGTPLWTFKAAESMLSPLQIGYSGDVVNTVYVVGATPKGAKKPLTWTHIAPASHPLSPVRLARNGVPRYLLDEISDESIRSLAEAKDIAVRRLDDGLRQAVTVTFDALPVPHLEPGDLIRAVDDSGSVTFRLNTFSLPLTAGQPMTVGYTRRVSLRGRTRNRR
jgi:hypothetical protein